jgi:hypothetical protein
MWDSLGAEHIMSNQKMRGALTEDGRAKFALGTAAGQIAQLVRKFLE